MQLVKRRTRDPRRAPVFASTVVCMLLASPACLMSDASDTAYGPERTAAEQRAALVDAPQSPACAWSNVVIVDSDCTGVLLHPEVVVQAGHCPTDARFIVSAPPLEPRRVAIEECRVHPDAGYGRGTDVGFCRLRERVQGFTPIPIARGCELDALVPGALVTAVGYGFDSDAGGFGVKRELPATVLDVGNELTVGGDGFGTCPGDSGGPAVLRLPGEQGLRIAGILSSTDRGVGCEEHVSYYTLLDTVIDWIEDETQLDLTPCFDREGAWAPTPQCVAIEDGYACHPQATAAASCGAAFAADEDTDDPSVSLTIGPEPHLVIADASDRGWGVREVSFEVLGANGRLLLRSDGQPPYELDFAAVRDGARRVTATARDFADHTASAEVVVTQPSTTPEPLARAAGCSASGGRRGSVLSAWLLSVMGLLRSRRRWSR